MAEHPEFTRGFNIGYVIACCNIQNLHDEPTIAWDALAELGIKQSAIDAMELSEYDSAAMSEILASRGDETLFAAE